MKLREFVVNSFPGVRGKKKKGHQPDSSTASIATTAVTVVTATTPPSPGTIQSSQNCTSPKKPVQDGNGNWFHVGDTKLGFFNRLLGKDNFTKHFLDKGARHSSCESEELFANSYENAIYIHPPYRNQDQNTPEVSPSRGDCECCVLPPGEGYVNQGHSNEWNESDTYSKACIQNCIESGVLVESPGYSKSLGHGGDPTYVRAVAPALDSTPSSQRGIRSRSRIRTNPWLPSPRPSPYSVRSFSFPCESSQSPSPSPSRASTPPPSSSDNVSPNTSPRVRIGNVPLFDYHQRKRHHRRYHSEGKSPECTSQPSLGFSPFDLDPCCSPFNSNRCRTGCSLKNRHSTGNLWSKNYPAQQSRFGHNKTNHINDLSFCGFIEIDSPLETKSGLPSIPKPVRRSTPSSGTVANRNSLAWDSETDSENVSLLSPSDDICLLTSNIEQLAHNISFEYEDQIGTSFEAGILQQDETLIAFKNLADHDSTLEPKVIKLEGDCQCPQSIHTSLVIQRIKLLENNSEMTEREGSFQPETSISTAFQNLLEHNMQTRDIAVQTDFVDDSDDGWFAGGSGCITEEEGEADEDAAFYSSEAECQKFWLMPDCMQDSTDTGYSSLSRDGRVDIEDDLNSTHLDVDGDTSWGDTIGVGNCSLEYSPDATGEEEALSGTVQTACRYNERPTSNLSRSLSLFDDWNAVSRSKRVEHAYTTSRHRRAAKKISAVAETEYCCCEDRLSEKHDLKAVYPTRKESKSCTSELDSTDFTNVVPYPYDVMRFGDVGFTAKHSRDAYSLDSKSGMVLTDRAHKLPKVWKPKSATRQPCSIEIPKIDKCAALSHIESNSCNSRLPSSPAGLTLARSTLKRFASSDVENASAPAASALPAPRSIREISNSIENNVLLLRQEKHLVNRKIREAREEELLRQQQKLRFQQLLDIHRKQILLETLQDLRSRLELQSSRLQASYSAVLDMQKEHYKHWPLGKLIGGKMP